MHEYLSVRYILSCCRKRPSLLQCQEDGLKPLGGRACFLLAEGVGILGLLLGPQQGSPPERPKHGREDEGPDQHQDSGKYATQDLQGRAVEGDADLVRCAYLSMMEGLVSQYLWASWLKLEA